MKFQATFQVPSVDFAAYRRRLADELSSQLTYGALRWIESILEIIPQWSGASRATFLHITREIGFSLTISQSGNAPDRTDEGERKSSGKFTLDTANGKFFFEYHTSLEHLVYNEYNNANISPDPGLFSELIKPGPYNFQEVGATAFLAVVKGTKLPDPTAFIKVTRVKVQ